MKKILLLSITILSYLGIQAQNDSIYFWKSNVLLEKWSVKSADLDSITFKRPSSSAFAQAPIPSRAAANVVSVFSDSYTNINVDFFNGNWKPYQTTLSKDFEETFNGKKDKFINYTNFNFVGIQFANPTADLSQMTHLHLNMYVPGAVPSNFDFLITVVDYGADGKNGGGDDTKKQLFVPKSGNIKANEWITIELPLEMTVKNRVGLIILENINAFKGPALSEFYIDNLYFFNTISNPNGINIAGPNVTDIDGNTYQSVTNCGQTFTKQNLNVSKYSDGTPIPQVQDPTQWANLTTGAWCYYNNNPANGTVYGKLYNWYAAAGIYDSASLANPALRKKLAPTGWHVPTDSEWSILINCLDPKADGGIILPNVAGSKMKSTGTIQAGTGLWNEPNTNATNESGFTGLPGGYRFGDLLLIGNFGYQSFGNIGYESQWWSSSNLNTIYASYRAVRYDEGNTRRFNMNLKKSGCSVRCVKD